MKNTKKPLYASVLCGCLFVVTASAQTMIENFEEYASDADLQAAWYPDMDATLSLSSYVASGSIGTNSMRVDIDVPANAWQTTVLTGPMLPAPIAIASTQYITLRIAGDPEFTNATYQMLFVYAFDANGNFGRWGAPFPTANTNWQVLNFLASGITAPWNSPGLPDMTNIVQFSFYLYGEGDPPGANPYSATIYIDDLQTRNTPLIEIQPIVGPAMIENFEEYASDAALQAAWSPSDTNATLSLSSYVDPDSTGTNSMQVDVDFPTNDWQTEVINGPMLPVPIAIAPTQYITLRVAGDPQFTNADYQQLFVYAFDGANNFGRWGAPVPTTTNWQILNFVASSIALPWNSPALPDLNDIVQFSFYLYGQGAAPVTEYTANIYIDDLQVRNTPLFPPPSPMRALIDNFEEYANDAALTNFYSYVDSPAATVTTASLQTPAPQGNNALELAIDFAPGQYPWGSVLSGVVAPFSLPTNAVVSFWLKGDPTLAPVADAGTSFWLSFYDAAGNGINFSTPAAPVISSQWTKLQASFDQFWSSTTVDTGNLVQWRILVEGWAGTASSPALSATVGVDDIQITVPPVLAVVRQGSAQQLLMQDLMPGTTYTLRMSADLSQWTTTTIQATNTSQPWPIPAGQQKGFFQLFYTP
jgi:hypothetical protein